MLFFLSIFLSIRHANKTNLSRGSTFLFVLRPGLDKLKSLELLATGMPISTEISQGRTFFNPWHHVLMDGLADFSSSFLRVSSGHRQRLSRMISEPL